VKCVTVSSDQYLHVGFLEEQGHIVKQPRHSEYGLDRFVAAQASSSTGLKTILRLAVGKQTFSAWLWERQSFSGQLQVNSRSMNNNQSQLNTAHVTRVFYS